jgi:predicted  nucleic acid-binding Zn-ribbon protein
MTSPNSSLETAVELARLRTELHATNANIGRIADALDKTLGDHEARLRRTEALHQATVILPDAVKDLAKRVTVLEAANQRTSGAVKALFVLATLPTTGLLLALLKGLI